MILVEHRVTHFALYTRLSIVFIQVWLNTLIEDHEPNVFVAPKDSSQNLTSIDNGIELLFRGFAHWDAQYFLHIAQHGYTYENTLAFFPLFPFTIKYLTDLILPLSFNFVSDQHCLLLVGLIFNGCCFVSAAYSLYKLSIYVTKSKEMSFITALLFCINPASVFFSSFYSESLFCALTFWGLLCLEKRNYSCALIGLGLSTCARSNGVLSVGFVVYIIARNVTRDMALCFNYNVGRHFMYCANMLFLFVKYILMSVVSVLIVLLPFTLYQFYAYTLFCMPSTSYKKFPDAVLAYAKLNNYTLSGTVVSEWCKYKVPYSYSYVQERYWNVGFLRYYETKQIPNFLLATPVLTVILLFSYDYFKKNQELVQNLGLRACELHHHFDLLRNEKCFVYFVHAFTLSLICILFINIQVSTRLLLSASPVPYWIAATYITSNRKTLKEIRLYFRFGNMSPTGHFHLLYGVSLSSGKGKLCFYYYIIYFNVGILMFVNNFPWT